MNILIIQENNINKREYIFTEHSVLQVILDKNLARESVFCQNNTVYVFDEFSGNLPIETYEAFKKFLQGSTITLSLAKETD
ncbi:hypothetical protein WA1_24500 [Scytonema hofmannii PCC 7110]|uniref:Uncharacterized protein n=1 Tax=Scytonema hofmannii PCC 7110 TaxID=128403 RepID=A0A139X7V7_9CYAN|nr:hypothetical protein [Scytonema hofmannii]KYC40789.1 hypothetical protein WA1_24500 [Scytonema hofmannii PCC 7110]